MTIVFRCDTSSQLESWWKTWSARFAPVSYLREGDGYGAREHPPPSHLSWDEIDAFYPNHVFLDSASLRRWEMAYQGLEIDPALNIFGRNFVDAALDAAQDELYHSRLVERRVGNWPTSAMSGSSQTPTPFLTMVFVTALYGGLHALCWKSHFPSYAEKMLWRISSCIIAGGPATLTVLFIILLSLRLSERAAIGAAWLQDILEYMGLVIVVPCIMVYGAARLFILLEAFISVRDLPAAAYQTPNWTLWLPHL
jgi:hypothetical protein